MSIDTLGYVKRLEAAGITREHAEAHAKALQVELVPQLATTNDLTRMGERLEAKFETLLWKHTAAIILAVMAAVGFAMRFGS